MLIVSAELYKDDRIVDRKSRHVGDRYHPLVTNYRLIAAIEVIQFVIAEHWRVATTPCKPKCGPNDKG